MVGAGVLLLLAAVGAVQGDGVEDQSIERLDLARSIRRALHGHPDLGAPRALLSKAQAEVSRANAGLWPTAELLDAFGVAPAARLGEVPPGLPEELAPVLSPSRVADYSDLGVFNILRVELRQPVYTFGKIKSGIAAAEWGRTARVAELKRARADVVLETQRAYWGCKLALASLELLEELEGNFSKAHDKARERLMEGKPGVTQPDVLKLQLGLSETRRKIAQVRKELGVALAGYRRALGLGPRVPVSPDEAALAPVDAPEIGPLHDLDTLVRERPEWHAAQAGVAAQQQRVALERAGYFPNVFLAGLLRWSEAPERADIENPFLVDEFNILLAGGFLGVQGTIDPLGTRAKVAEAEAEADERRAELEAARLGLPVEIEKARLGYVQAREVLELAKSERKAGRALAVLTFANFELGIGEAKEVLEAAGFFGRAEAAWHQAIHDFNIAVAELSRALGRELDPALAKDL